MPQADGLTLPRRSLNGFAVRGASALEESQVHTPRCRISGGGHRRELYRIYRSKCHPTASAALSGFGPTGQDSYYQPDFSEFLYGHALVILNIRSATGA